MNEDQLRQEIDDILEGHLHQLHAGGVSVRDVKEEAYPQLTDLAVRFAREAATDTLRDALEFPDSKLRAVLKEQMAALGEPEKTCDCKNWIRGKNCTEYHGGSPQ